MEMKKVIIGIIIAIAALAIAAVFVLVPLARDYGTNMGTYYTQVDNTKCVDLRETDAIEDDDEMRYEYTLPAYDDAGKRIVTHFTASRELREGAYLKLDVWPFFGVRNWEETEWEKIPPAAQVALPAPGAVDKAEG